MFERYTEKARRVIFFARYEASQYGSPIIATEHFLLGLLREDPAMMHRLVGRSDLTTGIRTEIDKLVNRREPLATSVEVPLSAESKKILNFAGEEADRLGVRHVGTEHILLAILRLPESLAAALLVAKGARVDAIRQQIAQNTGAAASVLIALPPQAKEALLTLDTFLAGLQGANPQQFAALFDERGQFIDSSGKRWIGRKEIEKGAETFLARFAKRNAKFSVEDTTQGPSQTLVASVLWEFSAVSGTHSKSILRMSVVLAALGGEWLLLLAQVTPVILGLEAAG
jgi:uncharacterized protein (TIGR02246 family)